MSTGKVTISRASVKRTSLKDMYDLEEKENKEKEMRKAKKKVKKTNEGGVNEG